MEIKVLSSFSFCNARDQTHGLVHASKLSTTELSPYAFKGKELQVFSTKGKGERKWVSSSRHLPLVS